VHGESVSPQDGSTDGAGVSVGEGSEVGASDGAGDGVDEAEGEIVTVVVGDGSDGGVAVGEVSTGLGVGVVVSLIAGPVGAIVRHG